MSTEPNNGKILPEEAEDVAFFSQEVEGEFLSRFTPGNTFLLVLEDPDQANPYGPGFITRLQLRRIRGFNYANAMLRNDSLNGFSEHAIQNKDVWVFALTDKYHSQITGRLRERYGAKSVSYVVRYPEIRTYRSD